MLRRLQPRWNWPRGAADRTHAENLKMLTMLADEHPTASAPAAAASDEPDERADREAHQNGADELNASWTVVL